EVAMDIAGHAHRLAIDLAEPGRCAETVDAGFELARVERQQAGPRTRDLGRRPLGSVIVARDLADRVSLAVVGSQFRRRERPAAAGNPRAITEIDGVEGPTPAAPGIRVAAKIADLTDVEIKIRQTDVSPDIERLGLPIEIQIAALQQA